LLIFEVVEVERVLSGPCFFNHQSSIINHQSSITNHQSPITNHQSPITNHQSNGIDDWLLMIDETIPFAIHLPDC
jgi:hypothetical protein